MNFANKLINLRVLKKLSAADLAEKLNLSVEKITSWEKGQEEPTASQLVQLSKILDISVDNLLGLSEDKSGFNPLASLAMPFFNLAPSTSKDHLEDEDDEEDEEFIKDLIAMSEAIERAKDKQSK